MGRKKPKYYFGVIGVLWHMPDKTPPFYSGHIKLGAEKIPIRVYENKAKPGNPKRPDLLIMRMKFSPKELLI